MGTFCLNKKYPRGPGPRRPRDERTEPRPTKNDKQYFGFFDLDIASTGRDSRAYLRAAVEEGMVVSAGGDLPKSLVVCSPAGSWQRVYISPLAPATLLGRLEGLSAMFPTY